MEPEKHVKAFHKIYTSITFVHPVITLRSTIKIPVTQVIKRQEVFPQQYFTYLIPTGKRLSELSNMISTKAEMTRGPVPSYSDKVTNVNV